MIKAVFFDIDGTLVSFKTHKIPQSTKDALAELKKKGIKVFIATGRPFAAVNNLDDCTFDGFITMNGAYCMTEEKCPIFKQPISPREIQSLTTYLKEKEEFPYMAATKDAMYINYINADVESIYQLINFPTPQMGSLEGLKGEDIYQIVAFFKKDKEAEIMQNVLPGCEAARWNPLFTDIISKGISKQVGIDKVLDYYGFELDEAMAFGDGGNDLQMLRHVPASVAMGNAVEEVRKSASYVTDPVDDDGIWNALRHFQVI